MEQRGKAHLILAHGAGSSAEFLARAFPATACGAATTYLDDRTGSVHAIGGAISEAAAALRPSCSLLLIGGVSLGAHAAAMACADSEPGAIDGLVAALPAWTGTADPSDPTALAAREVARSGADGVLQRLRTDPALRDDWVVAELMAAWRERPSLAAELDTAGRQPAPAPEQLRRIAVPALVLALRDDPVHPLRISRQWSGLIRSARMVVLDRDAPAADRGVFGAEVGRWLGGITGPR